MKKLVVAGVAIAAAAQLAVALPAAGSTLSAARAAQGSTTCTVTVVNGPDSNCGPYSYRPQITASNGFTTYVGIDGWACGPASPSHPSGTDCGPTRLVASSPGHWNLTTKEPKGNTGVLMYPSASQTYNNPSLSKMRLIRSGFTESMPHHSGTIAHAAYDIWLNNSGPSNEVMIDLDNVNWGPGGSKFLGRAVFNHERYTLYEYGGPGGELIWRINTSVRTGTVHILAMLRSLQKHGYIRRTSTLGIVGFGWEICSTGGTTRYFSVSKFWLHTM
jgi:hypothetical protein